MTHFANPYALDAMQPSVPEGSEFISGESLTKEEAEKTTLASRDAIVAALSTVFDPEIPVNIYDLGLIYGIVDSKKEGDLEIEMTLTAPACPVAGELPQQVADAAACIEGVGRVRVLLTWDPPWEPDMMSEDARYALGM